MIENALESEEGTGDPGIDADPMLDVIAGCLYAKWSSDPNIKCIDLIWYHIVPGKLGMIRFVLRVIQFVVEWCPISFWIARREQWDLLKDFIVFM